jgi:purine-binding chemotaxis protein CheW
MNTDFPKSAEQRDKFLLFKCHGELFGAPLGVIREIVPFQRPLRVPNTHKHYLGIVNIRGDVVGAIDLRFWFNDERIATKVIESQALLVVESQAGLMGIAVDTVVGISELFEQEIETPTGMPEMITEGGMIGIGKFTHGLATLLNLRALCIATDVVSEHKERRVS